jgi:hypothetical protein
MCDSAGSICDRRRAADWAGAECNVPSGDACHHGAATDLVYKTNFVADSQSDSAARRGSGFNTGSTRAHSWRASRLHSARFVGRGLNADDCAWLFTRNAAG